MSNTIKSNSTTRIGLVLLGVLLVAIVAASQTLLRGKRLDLTENQLYTLSDGTKDVLKDLAEPVNLYFFYSREQASKLGALQTWGRRVEELLLEMERAAGGQLNLEIIDPKPFSKQEDQATVLGIEAVPINNLGDSLYLGIAASNALDGVDVLPFLAPNEGPQLEYKVAKMVYQLGQLKKQKVGILSTLPIEGELNEKTFQQAPGWLAIEQLKELFDVEVIGAAATELPEDLDLLVMIHPANLATNMLYDIDQFVLGGGNALVFLDAHSELAMAMGGGGLMNASAAVPVSDLATLLPNWGAQLVSEKVVADADYALGLQAGPGQPVEYNVTLLGLEAESISEDDSVTAGLERLNIGIAGALEAVDGSDIQFTPLLQSSKNSGLLDSYLIQPNSTPLMLSQALAIDEQQHVIAARLRGIAKTAFPDGRPQIDGENKPSASDERASITQSAKPINVIAVSDTDMLTDRYWVQLRQGYGGQVAQPIASNLDFLLAAVDNLLGSSALIGIRSRSGYARPFEKVEDLKREADARYREKEEALQEELTSIEDNLAQLQSQSSNGNLELSPEDQRQIKRFMDQRNDLRQSVRDVQHELGSEIESLGRWLRFWNIAFVPLLLTVLALGVTMLRSRRKVTISG